ncbi:hypothetical protein AMJ57_03915, partial [Parcubacteria bacterium SG8_24]
SEGQLILHTSDTDWAGGTYTDTEVVGTGEPAVIQSTGEPEWILIGAGMSWYETSDTDFSDGTFSNTVVVDTGDLGAVSLDSAVSWAEMTSPATSHLNAVSLASSTLGFAVGDSGTIVRWDGTSWSTVTSPVSEHLFDIFMLSTTEGWAVGREMGRGQLERVPGYRQRQLVRRPYAVIVGRLVGGQRRQDLPL